ncbi:MAG TPA: hypothetical protein VNO43_16230 [Candidatus Eisenbacteria bacterium]|nr:hypothetical protein [Candidatus Eisenbacteria bacterium]
MQDRKHFTTQQRSPSNSGSVIVCFDSTGQVRAIEAIADSDEQRSVLLEQFDRALKRGDLGGRS